MAGREPPGRAPRSGRASCPGARGVGTLSVGMPAGAGRPTGRLSGRPKSQPWPRVAPRALAVVRCSSCSIPSARITAPERSFSAFTAFTIPAIATSGFACTRRRSSLITSGRRKGISASERWSAPTSSSATPQPRARSPSTAASSSAGRSASARSVISTNSRRCDPALVISSSAQGGVPRPRISGSTFTRMVLPRGSIGGLDSTPGGSPAGPVELGQQDLLARHGKQPVGSLERAARRVPGPGPRRPPRRGCRA